MQWGKHPGLRLLYAIPNGGHRHAAVAAKLKAEGVKAGVSDLCMPHARGPFHGFYGEMKSQAPGARPTKSQRHWIDQMLLEGYYGCVGYGWEDMRERLLAYLSLGPFHEAVEVDPHAGSYGQREGYIREPKILKAIHGSKCRLRTAWCRNGPAVPCHSNWQEDGKGQGIKAHDWFVVAGCSECHRWLDEGPDGKQIRRDVFHVGMKATHLWLYQQRVIGVL